MTTQQAFLKILEHDITQDQLRLPTLPEVALRVEKTANNPGSSLHDLVQVIGRDPALSARMVRLANSAWLGRAVKVENLQQALTRIGLCQVRSIVVGLAMEQLFDAKNDIVRARLRQCWEESSALTAAVLILLKAYDGPERLHQHTAALMAMTSQIGALPVLTLAEQHTSTFANPTFLNETIPLLAPSLNGLIMRAWSFTDEQVNVAEHWQGGVTSFKPSYLSVLQLAGILVGIHTAPHEEALLSCFVQTGLLPSIEWWQLEQVQQDYESVLAAFR